jgi:hypothetical protein
MVPPPPPPVAPAAAPAPSVPPPSAAAGEPKPKTPPPFPVMAPPKSGKTNPPIPHVSVKTEIAEPQKEEPAPEKSAGGKRAKRLAILGLVAVVTLGAAGFFAWRTFLAEPPPPPPAAKPKTSAPVAGTTKPATPAAKPATNPNIAPTPSETLNQIAHTPKKAIDKAQQAIEARRASGQSRIDAAALGEDTPDKPAAPGTAPAAKASGATKASAVTTIAPGLSATTEVEAAAEATPAFRSWVANVKVSSVFQSTPPRAFINGRLARAGDVVDSSLGIIFDGVDSEKHQLIFKDKSGATVARHY